MTVVPDEVWVTLMGEHLHRERDCQGILDGHAKAEREGKNTWEPELWPVRLAASGWPRMLGREVCQVCMADERLPAGGMDRPDRVAAAKRGNMARAFNSWKIARAQARAVERQALESRGETPPYYEDGDPVLELESMRQDMTPWDADYSTEDP